MSIQQTKRDLYPRVEDFYNGKSLLITGACGFVGMVFLEILLRTCPGVEFIYILIREKKGMKPEERKEKLFDKEIFQNLKENNPAVFDKVRVIAGDLLQPNLGISEEDETEIIRNVTIVIHSAADINFRKPLKPLMASIVVGTSYIIELCKKLKEIEALVYTSTMYSNCNRLDTKIEEEVYRMPFPSKRFLHEFENGTEESLNKLAAQCQPKWPIAYTFNKCLAENILVEHAAEIPLAIVRPSLVGTVWKAPHPGFAEKNSSLALLLIGAGKGFIKVIRCDPCNRIDTVPVDVVANCHIVAAWKIATGRSPSPLVVNCSSDGSFDYTWQMFRDLILPKLQTHSMPNCFRTPTQVYLSKNELEYRLLAFYHHYVPAYVFDFVLKLSGNKMRLVPLYQLFDRAMESSAVATCRPFCLHTEKFRALPEGLDEGDKEKFYTDISSLSLKDIIDTGFEGNEAFYWTKDRKTPEQRKKRAAQRHRFTTFIQYSFLVIVFTLLYFVTSKTCQLVGHFFV